MTGVGVVRPDRLRASTLHRGVYCSQLPDQNPPSFPPSFPLIQPRPRFLSRKTNSPSPPFPSLLFSSTPSSPGDRLAPPPLLRRETPARSGAMDAASRPPPPHGAGVRVRAPLVSSAPLLSASLSLSSCSSLKDASFRRGFVRPGVGG